MFKKFNDYEFNVKKNWFVCLEYPYLINPPQLISNDYNSIKIELNFQPDNMNGDGSLSLKYYQLFYEVKYYKGNTLVIFYSKKVFFFFVCK